LKNAAAGTSTTGQRNNLAGNVAVNGNNGNNGNNSARYSRKVSISFSPESDREKHNTPIRKSDTKSTTSLSPAASYFLDRVPSDDTDGVMNGQRNEHGHGQYNYRSPNRTRPRPPPMLGLSPNNKSTHKRLDTAIDFLKDDPATMTFSRRVAILLAERYKWYNPRIMNINVSVNGKEDYRNISNNNVNVNGDVEGALEKDDDNENDEPSIKAAWAFYEHMTLPRRLADPKQESTGDGSSSRLCDDEDKDKDEDIDNDILNDKDSGKGKGKKSLRSSLSKRFGDAIAGRGKLLKVAVAGETMYETKLYSPWSTPLDQMGDFGLGVGLYFGMLRAFFVLLILAGIMNIPNILFFAGSDYSNEQKGMKWHLKGSAACNVHQWVPLTRSSLTASPLKKPEQDRVQTVTNADGQDMTFVIKNMCDGAKMRVGMVNFGTVLLMILGMVLIARYLKKKQEEFDLDEQTAQDYSISITNPPKDAKDPEEWRNFFKNNFPDCDGMHVTSCTVAVDNDRLLDCLTRRRELLKNLKLALPDVKDVKDVEKLSELSDKIMNESNIIQRTLAKMFGVPAMYKQLVQLNTEIKELASKEYPVTSVFVMFETEKAQRHVLEKLTVSKHNVNRNHINALSNPNYLFRGKHVLDVDEAEEPSTIRWRELHLTKTDFLIKLFSTAIVFGLILAFAHVVYVLDQGKNGDSRAALAIAISNTAFPQVAKLLSKFERHSREEHFQVWLYAKIALFRWVNTALVISFITPFTFTVLPGRSVLDAVYKIFFAEIITSTITQYLDIGGNVKKHVLAPREKTQETMNLHFRGSEIFLAERYTNMTKIVFLALWYCPIYPAVLFFAAIALGVNYFLDSFSIMRTWTPQPKLGESISRYTTLFVFPILILIMSYIATTTWESFRFDRLCEDSQTIDESLVGTWELPKRDIINDANSIVHTTTETKYHSLCRNVPYNQQQEQLIYIYQAFTFVNLAVVGFVCLGCAILFVKKYFSATYEPVGADQNIPFRYVESMIGYVPQVSSNVIPYPLIACNVSEIKDSDLFSWEDPNRGYEEYDLTKDAEELLGEEIESSKAVFSKMTHWPFRRRQKQSV